MLKKEDKSVTNRVQADGVSMPASLANGFFVKAIEESQNQQLKINPNYKLMVDTYYQTSDGHIKIFLCSQMSKLRRMESNLETQNYLAWFEENIDTLSKKDFGDFALYQTLNASNTLK